MPRLNPKSENVRVSGAAQVQGDRHCESTRQKKAMHWSRGRHAVQCQLEGALWQKGTTQLGGQGVERVREFGWEEHGDACLHVGTGAVGGEPQILKTLRLDGPGEPMLQKSETNRSGEREIWENQQK